MTITLVSWSMLIVMDGQKKEKKFFESLKSHVGINLFFQKRTIHNAQLSARIF